MLLGVRGLLLLVLLKSEFENSPKRNLVGCNQVENTKLGLELLLP